jgi:hypothetical protein
VLALATLSGATQIGLFLLVSIHPSWVRQVRKAILYNDTTDVLPTNFANGNEPLEWAICPKEAAVYLT